MIGQPYNPAQCCFLLSQSLNANQFDPSVPDTGVLTPHNLLWNFVENKLQWVETLVGGIIVQELSGGSVSPTIDNYVQTWFFQVQSNRVGVGAIMPSSSPLLQTSLHCFPFRLPSLLTAKTIAVDYRGGGDASFKLKVGIYKLNQGTLVWESPEITVTAIATYAINGLDVDLPQGIYYFVVSHNSVANITLRGGLADNTIPVMENGYGSISGSITNRFTFSPYVYSPTLPPLLSAVSGGNPQNNAFTVAYVFFKT